MHMKFLRSTEGEQEGAELKTTFLEKLEFKICW
jgi:hypothetical protein